MTTVDLLPNGKYGLGVQDDISHREYPDGCLTSGDSRCGFVIRSNFVLLKLKSKRIPRWPAEGSFLILELIGPSGEYTEPARKMTKKPGSASAESARWPKVTHFSQNCRVFRQLLSAAAAGLDVPESARMNVMMAHNYKTALQLHDDVEESANDQPLRTENRLRIARSTFI